jgi:hypothetical protein
MATTKIEIWNLALGACGTTGRISSETENSTQANICRQWYDTTRLHVNKLAPWPCALDWAQLAVKAERDFGQAWAPGDPGPNWRYAYSLPSNHVAPFYIMGFGKYELGLHSGVPSLMTNTENAILRYVVDQPVVSYWDNGFQQAVFRMLAFNIVSQVNAKLGSRDRLREEAFEFINAAREEAANQAEFQVDALPEAIAARGYEGPARQEVFFNSFTDRDGDFYNGS